MQNQDCRTCSSSQVQVFHSVVFVHINDAANITNSGPFSVFIFWQVAMLILYDGTFSQNQVIILLSLIEIYCC